MASELLPCPFCGSVEQTINQGFVTCDSCQGDGPYSCGASEEKAIAAWNTRAAVLEAAAPAQAGGEAQTTPKRSLGSVLEELCPGVRKRNWPSWAGPYHEENAASPLGPKMTAEEE